MQNQNQAKTPTEFGGLIDVFKVNKIYELNIVDVVKKGDVVCEMDKEISRKVIKISGNLSPGNNITIPNSRYTRSLNYVGKYYYIFFKAYNDRKFSFQFTFIFNNLYLVRFIFKFPLKQLKPSKTNSYNIEIPITLDENRSGVWSLYKFDPAEFVSKNLASIKDWQSLSGMSTENTVLRTFEAFSSFVIRGIYISNNSYNLSNLPKDLSIRGKSDSIYYYDVCNGEITDIQIDTRIEEMKVEIPKTVVTNYVTEDFTKEIEQINSKETMLREINDKSKKVNISEQIEKKINEAVKKLPEREKINIVNNDDLKEMTSDLLIKHGESINQEYLDNKKEALRNLLKKEEHKKTALLPDPIMHLSYILGFTASKCPKVQYNSSGEYDSSVNTNKDNLPNPLKKNIFFTSGTTLIRYDPINIKQYFFFGHSKPITNFILACKGALIFSNQEGTNSIIRIWKTESARCMKMLTTPFEKIKVLTEGKDSKYLCVVGKEQNKESIIIYNISDLENINVFIRQSTPSSISCMKFSPFDKDILVSCGKENIRFWTIRKDHLSGKAVVLNQYARGTNFGCLDFNNTMFGDEFSKDKGKIYVGSDSGCIFQVDCESMELEAVYKVQDAEILSIAVNEAYCVTGSKDGYLRVWPVDFSEFLIEAKHDSGVCSVDISYDAIEILCGTENGSIGVLNVQTKIYKTILRSPPSSVKQMIIHPNGNFLFTIEDDMSVRVWDIEHKSEAFQFLSSKDPPTALAAPKSFVFSCGFKSGILKIFDLEKTEILYECKPFQSEVKKMQYIQQDKFLVCMGIQGNMSIHDANNNYIQVKILKIDQPCVYADLSYSLDEDYFATIGPDSNCVLVWNASTFGIKNRVPVNSFFVKKILLVNRNLLVVILENCCIRFYSLATYEGIFFKELLNIHINAINEFLISKNYKFLLSAGEEGMIKIWDMRMVFKNIQSFQHFIGHSSGVRAIILVENKSLLISTSENSGIYFWNFLGDVTFTETEITNELDKLSDSNLMKEIVLSKQRKNLNQTVSSVSGAFFASQGKKKMSNTTSNLRIQQFEKEYKTKNNEILNKGNKQEGEVDQDKSVKNVFEMLPIIDEKDGVDINYSNTDFNISQENINASFMGDKDNKELVNHNEVLNKLLFNVRYNPEKLDKLVLPEILSCKLSLKYCLGLSINSIHNFVFNKEDKWYAFTVNNKIIIEFFEGGRKNKILMDSKDELSCLTLSPNNKFLISGIGSVNREEYAAIFIYDAKTFKLTKKLPFHFKGIQKILVSQNNKYMISIGARDEKSICIWNFTNLTVIDSKSVKFSIIDCVCVDSNESSSLLYFVTISQNVISFWSMEDFKMSGYHINFEDLTRERVIGEFLVSLAITPYYEQLKGSFIFLGTDRGNILILERESKNVIKKFCIAKFPITHIFYFEGNFICCGESPLVFHWKFDNSNLTISDPFSFFEKKKANLLFLDSPVNAIEITNNGKDGLLTTDLGSIFFINLHEKTSLKIISSHIRCKIPNIICDQGNQNLFSCGQDGTVRCWTTDSYDQKFQLTKPEQIPQKCLINPKENALIIHYDCSFLRLYNMETMKSLGKIQIPQYDISDFVLVFNYKSILLTTVQSKLFLLDIQNWEPLNVLHSQLSISSDSIPKNQCVKSLQAKNINPEKCYACTTYGDGTVSVYSIEKINGNIEVNTLDTFNMIQSHMEKTEDNNIQEIYASSGNCLKNYSADAKFSNKFDGVLLCFHQSLQFLYVRNYLKNEMIKSIPLNYFPYSFDLSDDERFIAIGSKEGLILFITRSEDTYVSGFNLEIFSGHYDSVDVVKFGVGNKVLYSTSYSEILIWNLNV